VPRPWDDRGFEKRRQTLPVCQGFSQSLARKNNSASRRARPLLEERDRCGADRHKKTLNLGSNKNQIYLNILT
jgi:hypothetical protein